jgi:hypothetical protein
MVLEEVQTPLIIIGKIIGGKSLDAFRAGAKIAAFCRDIVGPTVGRHGSI